MPGVEAYLAVASLIPYDGGRRGIDHDGILLSSGSGSDGLKFPWVLKAWRQCLGGAGGRGTVVTDFVRKVLKASLNSQLL